MKEQSKQDGKFISNIRLSKNKATLYFGKEKLILSLETFSSFYLFKGKFISKEELNKIKKANKLDEGFQIANKILSRALIPEDDLKNRLIKKGINSSSAEEIVRFYVKNGVISDEAYIVDMLYYYEEKLYGELRIKNDLKKRFIKEKDIDKIKFPFKKELNKANKYKLILLNKYKMHQVNNLKDKIYSSLLVHGFTYDVIKECIKDLSNTPLNIKKDSDIEKYFQKALRLYEGKYECKKEEINHIISYLKGKGFKYSDIRKYMEEINYGENDF